MDKRNFDFLRKYRMVIPWFEQQDNKRGEVLIIKAISDTDQTLSTNQILDRLGSISGRIRNTLENRHLASGINLVFSNERVLDLSEVADELNTAEETLLFNKHRAAIILRRAWENMVNASGNDGYYYIISKAIRNNSIDADIFGESIALSSYINIRNMISDIYIEVVQHEDINQNVQYDSINVCLDSIQDNFKIPAEDFIKIIGNWGAHKKLTDDGNEKKETLQNFFNDNNDVPFDYMLAAFHLTYIMLKCACGEQITRENDYSIDRIPIGRYEIEKIIDLNRIFNDFREISSECTQVYDKFSEDNEILIRPERIVAKCTHGVGRGSENPTSYVVIKRYKHEFFEYKDNSVVKLFNLCIDRLLYFSLKSGTGISCPPADIGLIYDSPYRYIVYGAGFAPEKPWPLMEYIIQINNDNLTNNEKSAKKEKLARKIVQYFYDMRDELGDNDIDFLRELAIEDFWVIAEDLDNVDIDNIKLLYTRCERLGYDRNMENQVEPWETIPVSNTTLGEEALIGLIRVDASLTDAEELDILLQQPVSEPHDQDQPDNQSEAEANEVTEPIEEKIDLIENASHEDPQGELQPTDTEDNKNVSTENKKSRPGFLHKSRKKR